jgi:hypothetical protein
VALTTSAAEATRGMVARPLQPSRGIGFALLWRDATPAPALDRLIRCAAGAEGMVALEPVAASVEPRAA